MNNRLRHQYLTEIGIQTWLLKTTADELSFADAEVETKSAVESFSVPIEIKTAAENKIQKTSEVIVQKSLPKTKVLQTLISLDTDLINKIESCSVCNSRKNHLKVLSGEGNADADVFFISEAPNAEEEREGHYLTGEVQLLFKKMLQVIEITNSYYFTGLVKCHSFENYLLIEEEINNCQNHLFAQLNQIKPKVLVLLGSVQAQAILKSKDSFKQLRKQVHKVEINNRTYQAIVSYHPAYLLRNPLYKREALEDLILIKSLLQHTP